MKVPKLKPVTVSGVFAHAIMTSKGPGYEYRNTDGESCDENGVLDSVKDEIVVEEKPEEVK